MRRLVPAALAALALATGCDVMKEEKMVLDDPRATGEAKAARKVEKVEPSAFVFDHFSRANDISSANSRFGAIEANLTTKPDLADAAVKEAQVFIGFAVTGAEREGRPAEVQFLKKTSDSLGQAVAAAKAGDAVKAMELYRDARRQLDMAIEQCNATLVPKK